MPACPLQCPPLARTPIRRGQYQQSWAEEMIQVLLNIKAEVEAAPLEQMSLAPERLTHFEQRYDELISQGL
jgi:hypothetical protein